ncbi:MESH1 pyrophosphohydrolase, partial [Polypterus senegalus]
MNLDSVLLLEAVHFAAEKHKSQRRKDTEATPYINHPIGVARILAYEGGITDIAILQVLSPWNNYTDNFTIIYQCNGSAFICSLHSILSIVSLWYQKENSPKLSSE